MTVWNVSTDAWGPSPKDATDRVFSSLPSLRLSPAAVPTREAVKGASASGGAGAGAGDGAGAGAGPGAGDGASANNPRCRANNAEAAENPKPLCARMCASSNRLARLSFARVARRIGSGSSKDQSSPPSASRHGL